MGEADHIQRGPAVEGGPATKPQPVTLEGRTVTLAPLDPKKDAADLFGPTHGEGKDRLFAYLFDGPFANEAAMAEALEKAAAPQDNATLAIRDKDGRTVGRATFMRVEINHRTVEVGSILFSPALARTAAATEAMYLMAKHVFEDLRFRRYEWKCDALNAPSRAAAKRFGFRFEGVFLKHMVIKGHSRDTAWYAMTEDDWPRVKRAFEAWLSADNFDEAGRQKRGLVEIRESL